MPHKSNIQVVGGWWLVVLVPGGYLEVLGYWHFQKTPAGRS